MYIIGHRGAKGYAPENTIESIQKAIELKADYIEIDIQSTRDGHIILMHDKQTAKGLVVARRTYKTLRRELPNIITLQDAIKAAKGSKLILESKSNGTVAKAHRILSKQSNIWISSFISDEVLSSRINLPNHKTFLLKSCPAGSIGKAQAVDASGVGYNWVWLVFMPYYYWLATKNGLEIYIYTLNVVFIAKVLSKIFPKLLIVTDYPDKLLNIQS